MIYPHKKMAVHQQRLLLLEGSLIVDKPHAPHQGWIYIDRFIYQ